MKDEQEFEAILREVEPATDRHYDTYRNADQASRDANKLIIDERRAAVAKLVHARVPRYKIAKILKVTMRQVRSDIEWLRGQWQAESLHDFAEQREQELESLAVWEARLTEWCIKTRNSNYVRCIMDIKARRAKMLGLDQPTKIAPTNPDGTAPYAAYAALGEADLDKIITELVGKLGGVDTDRPTDP